MDLGLDSACDKPLLKRVCGRAYPDRVTLAVSINALSRCPNGRRRDPPARISWYSRTLQSGLSQT